MVLTMQVSKKYKHHWKVMRTLFNTKTKDQTILHDSSLNGVSYKLTHFIPNKKSKAKTKEYEIVLDIEDHFYCWNSTYSSLVTTRTKDQELNFVLNNFNYKASPLIKNHPLKELPKEYKQIIELVFDDLWKILETW